ncbi:MAG: hypothetical protein LBS28_05275 [Streptococcaceae bacterium]|jgi:acetyltransferase EpsM|nr:hypothetical protein [Streptococcaceae bacterium]
MIVIIRDFVHLAPNSIICGKVSIGESTLIGASLVIKPGLTIGKNAIIGRIKLLIS